MQKSCRIPETDKNKMNEILLGSKGLELLIKDLKDKLSK
jgi:hypothetical protein